MSAPRVIQLWCYPVKSMLGQCLDEALLTPEGVEGDRGYALRSRESGRILSAKKVSRLLHARAKIGTGVTVLLPDGSQLSVNDPETPARLSSWLGFDVELVRAPGGSERPFIEGDNGVFRGRPGGFFDSSAVHIITTSTLARFAEWHPEGRFDARRFRPNVLLESAENGFVEEGWIGRTVALGDALIEITKSCSRCVMTTHAMDDLPVDREILRTVNAHNDEHVGVYGIVREPGVVRIGDEATIA